MAATRQFFRKARNVVHPPKLLKRPRPPNHKRKVVMGVRLTGTGTIEHKAMSSRTAAQVLGGQKGGLRSAALGTAHRWTSESARKAAVKSWTKRRKFNKRIQARVGVAANRRPGLWREPLRAYYAENPQRGIQWIGLLVASISNPDVQYASQTFGYWKRINADDTTRVISERAALTALGHLKSSRGYIPDTITPVRRHSDKD